MMTMFGLSEASCIPPATLFVNVALACTDALIALLAFYQLIRIHSRNAQHGWTRQKVFHLLIGSSNVGYFVYFVVNLIATCKGWLCWSSSCGFIVMACPKILFLAAFLLLLSFWVDLCHQADDDDEDDVDRSVHEALLEKKFKKPNLMSLERHCCPFPAVHIGSRQKMVILITLLVTVIMVAAAVLIWIGMGKNPIDSLLVARVYVDLFALAILLLGGALVVYGTLLSLKMRRVRSERAASDMWKVAGLAIVSVLCFTSSALVAFLTDIPVMYHQQQQNVNGLYTSILLILYFFIGSSVPSAFVLWVMRELPPVVYTNNQEDPGTIAFIYENSVVVSLPQSWTTTASSQNQISRASPI